MNNDLKLLVGRCGAAVFMYSATDRSFRSFANRAAPSEVRALWVVRTTLESSRQCKSDGKPARHANGFNTLIVAGARQRRRVL